MNYSPPTSQSGEEERSELDKVFKDKGGFGKSSFNSGKQKNACLLFLHLA